MIARSVSVYTATEIMQTSNALAVIALPFAVMLIVYNNASHYDIFTTQMVYLLLVVEKNIFMSKSHTL